MGREGLQVDAGMREWEMGRWIKQGKQMHGGDCSLMTASRLGS